MPKDSIHTDVGRTLSQFSTWKENAPGAVGGRHTDASSGLKTSGLPELTRFRSYQQTSMVFNARVSDGKVVTQGSFVGQEIADQLNQLPKRYRQDPEGKGSGLRLLDDKLNVFHIQSTDAAAAVFKSSRSLLENANSAPNPGRAHLGQASGVFTLNDGTQFRLAGQQLHRFEPQTLSWVADKKSEACTRIGLTSQGSLMKVPQGVIDRTVDGAKQMSLMPGESGNTLELLNTKDGAEASFVPLSQAGQPLQLTCVGLTGNVLYGANAQGELFRGNVQTAQQGEVSMLPVATEHLALLHKGPVQVTGFMHDDNAKLNVLLVDSHKQLHSTPLTGRPGAVPGWNLSDVLLKVIDKGLPVLHVGGAAIDLGERGKVALQGSTLLCWDATEQRWNQTGQDDIEHLEQGLDGRAYVVQAGELKSLATHNSREPIEMGASYDLALPTAARTQMTFDKVMVGTPERLITGFAVENANRFVSLDSQKQLHAHMGGKETPLAFSVSKDVHALALDHHANLYALTGEGELLRLDKNQWQSSPASSVTWTPVALPNNEPLQSLHMGADKHLIASSGQSKVNQRLDISNEGKVEWGPVGGKPGQHALPMRTALAGAVMGGHLTTSSTWSAASTVLGQTTEGVGQTRHLFKSINAHFKPIEGSKNIARDIQHQFKGRAGLQGLYADDKVIREQLGTLAKLPPASLDMHTRLDLLSASEPTQALASQFKDALVLLESNSLVSASRLGELRGKEAKGGSGDGLKQMCQAFEHSAPLGSNQTATLLRNLEAQGISLPKWSAEKTRDLKNPSALVESDLIHHAQTLSHLSQLTTELAADDPDLTGIGAKFEQVMNRYHESPVHNVASKNINSYEHAEALYSNFKLLAKDLGTPGSALHFHLAHTLGIAQGDGVKQALLQDIQQSASGQAITSSRDKTAKLSLLMFGMPAAPVLELNVGVSREKANAVVISRTDLGVDIDIKMNTTHGLSASAGAGIVPLELGDATGLKVRTGADINIAAAQNKGSTMSFSVKEADLPDMMEILMGAKGNVFDLLEMGTEHTYDKNIKNSLDLTLSAFAQGRAHHQLKDGSGALGYLIRAAIGGAASLNVAHWDKSQSVTQSKDSVTQNQGSNLQLFNKATTSVGLGLANTVSSVQVGLGDTTLTSSTTSDLSFSVSFDRSRTRAFSFTFKQPPPVEQSQINTLRDLLSNTSVPLKHALEALPAEGVETGEQLQSLQRLVERSQDKQPALKEQLHDLVEQHSLGAQGKRVLSSVESTVSYVGLSANSTFSWLDDVSPANKAQIIKFFQRQPQLVQTLIDLQHSTGTSATINVEVKPDVLRKLQAHVADGRDPQADVELALKDPDNLRIKSLSVSYKASSTAGMTLPIPVLSLGSKATLSNSQKVLSAVFEYGADHNVPLRVNLKAAPVAPAAYEQNEARRDHEIRTPGRQIL